MSRLKIHGQEVVNALNPECGPIPHDTTEPALDFGNSGLTMANSSTQNTLTIDQNGDVGSNATTDGALFIENTGNPGIGLTVYTNAAAEASAPLVYFKSDNLLFDQFGIRLDYDGVSTAFKISQSGLMTTADRLIEARTSTNQTGGHGLFIAFDGSGSTKNVGYFLNAGTGHDLFLDQNGDGNALNIDSEATTKAGLQIDTLASAHINFASTPAVGTPADGDFWFDGTNLKFRAGGATKTVTAI